MLYSIMEIPTEEKRGESYYLEVEGGKLSLIKKGEDLYEVSGLISTDPKSFLNPLYTPGKRVRVKDLSGLKR